MRLALVPNLHLPDVWLKALPHVLNGKEYWEQFYTIHQLKKNLFLGAQQLWLMIEESDVLGIVITQIDDYPEVRVLRICYLGGKGLKRDMIPLGMGAIEAWARGKNCKLVDILGRDEWLPLVKKQGYNSPGRVYRKEL
jgi:hypothetical protein